MSPCMEQTVVLWALREIDRRLPEKVDRDFGHLMVGNTTLADVQVQIFQKLPTMLKELDEVEMRSITTSSTNDPVEETSLGAGFARNPPRRPNRGRGTQWSAQRRGSGPSRGRTANGLSRNGEKFCKLWFVAGKSSNVTRYHNLVDCSGLSDKDRQQILTSSLGNIDLASESKEYDDADTPLEEIHSPGWDDDNSYCNDDTEINYLESYFNLPFLGSIIPVPSHT